MDKPFWIAILIFVGLIAAFGDALFAFVRGRLSLAQSGPEPVPDGLLELMARDLASGEAKRVERATAALLRIPGPAPVAYLTGLLRHQRAEVARQAAYILYERQDAHGLPPLYEYLANVRG